jgi:hypothetical protein
MFSYRDDQNKMPQQLNAHYMRPSPGSPEQVLHVC